MKNKILTIVPILFYSGFASASLYIHQPVEQRSFSDNNNLRIVFDKDKVDTFDKESKEMLKNNSDLVVSSSKPKEEKHLGKESYKKEEKESTFVAQGKETHKEKNSQDISVPRYDEIVLSQEHSLEPKVKTIYAKMDRGFLSNSMRQHLEKLGWELRWSSGSDRNITVPYVIEHKENDVIEFVTRISELYDIFIDVYPSNKTIHVSE